MLEGQEILVQVETLDQPVQLASLVNRAVGDRVVCKDSLGLLDFLALLARKVQLVHLVQLEQSALKECRVRLGHLVLRGCRVTWDSRDQL